MGGWLAQCAELPGLLRGAAKKELSGSPVAGTDGTGVKVPDRKPPFARGIRCLPIDYTRRVGALSPQLNPSGRIPERIQRNSGVIHHSHEQIRRRSLLRHLYMPAAFRPHHQQRQIYV